MKHAIPALLIFCMILSSSACSKAAKTTDSSSETSLTEKTTTSETTVEPETETETEAETTTEPAPTTEATLPDPLPVDSTYFPDSIFRTYVSENIDADSDGFLSKEEREAAQAIEIYSAFELSSLVGLEHFPNITKLTFEGGQVTSLDVSKNLALEYIDCSNNEISELDVSGCVNLKRVCGMSCPVSKLNVSGCTSLESLDFSIDCNIDTLTGLSDCKDLKVLEFWQIDAKLLTIGDSPKLETLKCIVDDLSELDTSHNPALRELRVTGTTGQIDVSQNVNLEILEIEGWENTSADFQSSLDLTHNPKLRYLNLANTRFQSIDLSKNPELVDISITSNPNLTELDLSGNPKLEILRCYNNALTSINTSNNPALKRLSCAGNALSEIDISGNPLLSQLSCDHNRLSSLDTSPCPHLYDLSCDNNKLITLDLSGNRELRNLKVDHNNIAELNVSASRDLHALRETKPDLRDGVYRYFFEKTEESYISLECDPTTKVKF